MKKFLSIILALMLALTMSVSIVMADEPTETAEQTEVVEEATTPEVPADFDESSIMQYLIMNFADLENITIDSYITGTDGTLDYYSDLYASYGQPVEETEYDGKRALSMGQSALTLDTLLESAGVIYIGDEGFFADKNTFVYGCGTMLSSGFSEGDKIATVVFDFGNSSEAHEIIAGRQNSFMVKKYAINWINVLIFTMCLIVLVLLIVIVTLTVKKKKAMQAAEETSEFVSEDDMFDTLVTEAAEEIEEVSEVEEVEEAVEKVEETVETVEEAVEDTEEK